jgi:hypothetical protein
LLQAQRPIAGTGGYTSEIWIDDHEPLADDMRAVLTAGASIGAVRPIGEGRSRFQIKTGLSRYIAIAQKKNWPKKSEEAARRELMSVIGVSLLPDPMTAAGEVIEELHPISDLAGYAAELNVTKLTQPSRQPLIRGVLGAGATVSGAVLRDQRVDGRYFVSSDLYKTLLLIRAGAVGARREPPPALGTGRSYTGGALQDAPPQLTSGSSARSLTHRLQQASEASANDPGDDIVARLAPAPRTRPAAPPPAQVDLTLDGCIDEIVRRLGIDAGAEDIEWLLDDNDDRPAKAGEALEKLIQSRTTLGAHIKDLERARRAQINSEVARLDREAAGADATRRRFVTEAGDAVFSVLPMLLLLPGGQFEGALRHCLEQLDAAGAPDSGHREVDHRMQRQMRLLASELGQQGRDTYESWAAVEGLLANYDERGPTLTVISNA